MTTGRTPWGACGTGYSLLEKLATLKPDEYDRLDGILAEWTVSDIKRVLGELRYRLDLIMQLEKLVDSASTDELHDLQPLFERGLWLFGPEFESVSFMSNRALATVVEGFFGGAALTTPKKRPDFVVLPEASIGVYACDSFDANHEVDGLAKVVIVELKKGGFEITGKEKDQANAYARQIRKSGRVKPSTPIVCHVLGSKVDPDARESMTEGATKVIPRSYAEVLRGAHARTFHLLKEVKSVEKWRSTDADLEAVLAEDALPLFDDLLPGPSITNSAAERDTEQSVARVIGTQEQVQTLTPPKSAQGHTQPLVEPHTVKQEPHDDAEGETATASPMHAEPHS